MVRGAARTTTALMAIVILALSLVASTSPAGAQVPPGGAGGTNASGAGRPTDMSPRLKAVAQPAVATDSDQAHAAAAGLPAEGPGSLARTPDGRLVVDVTLADPSPAGLASLASAGAEVVATDDGRVLVTVSVPATSLQALADLPAVAYVTEVPAPMTSAQVDDTPDGGAAAPCPTGILSEGDAQLRADLARAAYGVDGSSVEVGVLSDSFDDLGGAAADVTGAELPGAANPCGNTTPVGIQAELGGGGSDEGRAMAQIVHDLAPGAELTFATAFLGELDFANQITNLGLGGADVITDDIYYFLEPMFQDGPIAAAINDNRTLRDILHFTTAGNSNVIVGGREVASYEAPAYRPTPCPAGIPAYNESCHDFFPNVGTDAGNGLTLANNGSILMGAGWSEPMYGVTTDFDLYLVDTTTNTVVASSELDNASSKKANEYLSYTNNTGGSRTFDVVVGRYSGGGTGTPRIKTTLFRSSGLTAVQYNDDFAGDVVGPTLVGHSAAALAMGTAAVPYSSSAAPETYSSRGPQAICWEPDSGGVAQPAKTPCDAVQPDLAATDGTANSFFGSFDGSNFRFFGTSAAAPHAAAVAALIREAYPAATADEVEDAMTSSAVPVGAFGTDSVGAGLVDALGALDALAPPLAAPVVTDVDPAQGLTTGGQTVTITGTGFTGTTAVRFGPTNAASFSVDSDTTITATTPARPDGLVHVKVTTPAGTSGTSNDTLFGFVVPSTQAPTVTSVYPNVGALEGGTIVEIKGTSFIDATAVSFGPTAAASFTIVNNSTIMATSPARPDGLVNIKVTNSVGTSVGQPSAWYYFRAVTGPPPEVTKVSPKQGSNTGGATITITGTGFTDATAVRFGPTNATSYTVDSDTTITATTPARPNGLVNVTVVTQNGTSLPGSPAWYIYKTIP